MRGEGENEKKEWDIPRAKIQRAMSQLDGRNRQSKIYRKKVRKIKSPEEESVDKKQQIKIKAKIRPNIHHNIKSLCHDLRTSWWTQ